MMTALLTVVQSKVK